jgi:nucleotide-binding universal stress UspA family protein
VEKMYKKIVVPLDGSKLAECVLPHVETLAKGCHVESILFVRVVEPIREIVAEDYASLSSKEMELIHSEMSSEAEGYLQQLVRKIKYNDVKIEGKVLFGKAAETLSEYAAQTGANLIVIATHGRSGVSRWVWGSVADRILRSSCVPVLMVRAPGCVPGV